MKPAAEIQWAVVDAVSAPAGTPLAEPTVVMFALEQAGLFWEAAVASASVTAVFLSQDKVAAKLTGKSLEVSRAFRGTGRLAPQKMVAALMPILTGDVRPRAFTFSIADSTCRIWILPAPDQFDQLAHVLGVTP